MKLNVSLINLYFLLHILAARSAAEIDFLQPKFHHPAEVLDSIMNRAPQSGKVAMICSGSCKVAQIFRSHKVTTYPFASQWSHHKSPTSIRVVHSQHFEKSFRIGKIYSNLIKSGCGLGNKSALILKWMVPFFWSIKMILMICLNFSILL